jgi:hypothetical protein
MGGAESIRLEIYGKPCWNALANRGDSCERAVGFEFWVLSFESRSAINGANTKNPKPKTQNLTPLRACSQTKANLDAKRSAKT